MPYFAVALARKASGWTGQEVDLDEYEDLDGVTELLRDMLVEDGAGPALLMVEENDEYMLAVRIDGDGDPRSFISDVRAVETSELAAKFYDLTLPEVIIDEDDDEAAARPEGEPGGDDAIASDLGTPSADLLDLCSVEGNLPADVIYAVCERAGCAEVLEDLRGA